MRCVELCLLVLPVFNVPWIVVLLSLSLYLYQTPVKVLLESFVVYSVLILISKISMISYHTHVHARVLTHMFQLSPSSTGSTGLGHRDDRHAQHWVCLENGWDTDTDGESAVLRVGGEIVLCYYVHSSRKVLRTKPPLWTSVSLRWGVRSWWSVEQWWCMT